MSPARHPRALVPAVLLALALLAGCQSGPAPEMPEEMETPQDEVDEGADDAQPVEFVLPMTCQDILPQNRLDTLLSGEIDLLRGPGSGSTDTVYPEGLSPQEERGGISCLFGNLDETETFTLSVAPMTQTSRAEVIDGLLSQKLNPGQTTDGVLTYWIQGDDGTVPAIYNAVYPDAWYEALIFPGGRLAYEESSSLVAQMRQHTTERAS
jgi:hypothetical protein